MNKIEKIIQKQIQDRIKYKFKSSTLFNEVFNHPSFVRKQNNNNFERLEFLGDKVLGLIIANFLYDKFTLEAEGGLSQRIAVLVSSKTLLNISRNLKIQEAIILINKLNESKSIADSILTDTLEALIGAIFVDSGIDKAKKFVLDNWEVLILQYSKPPRDPKSLLQEWAMANNFNMPIYNNYTKNGPDHAPVYSVLVCIKSFGEAYGQGNSKKSAESNAAKNLFEKIN